MRTFISIKIALLPFALFWVASGLQQPLLGALAGALFAVIAFAYRIRSGGPRLLEGGAAVALTALAMLRWSPFVLYASYDAAFSFIALGLICATSVLVGRPWTAAYSAAAWPAGDKNSLFYRINRLISVLWAALFCYVGVAHLLGFAPVMVWMPLAAGIMTSYGLPPYLVRRALRRKIAERHKYSWPAPDFDSIQCKDTDVVVVGAGLGGLTSAALLAQAGLHVTVIEQHDVAGGFSHTWLRKGRDGDARPIFRFDSGVHDVSGWWDGGPVRGVLQRLRLEQRLEWRRLDHRYVSDERAFDVPRDWQDYVEQLAHAFPSSAAGIRAAMADIRSLHTAIYSTGAGRCGIPRPPDTVEELLAFARRYPLAARWLDQPFDQFLQSHIDDPSARQALMKLAGYVTDDFASASVYQMVPLFGYYLHGGFYPLGGSGTIADALVEAIESYGGRVRLKTPVAQVRVENGRACGVTLDTGELIRAGAVIMNGDFIEATQKLVDPAVWPAEFRQVTEAAQPSCSACAVHLGVRGEYTETRPVIHVSSHDGGLGIVIPSAVDPSAATPGYSSIALLRLMSHAEAAKWFGDPQLHDDKALRSSTAYLERKRAMGDALIALAERALPGLSGRIVLRADASPVTVCRYAWSSYGSIYGATLPAGRIGNKSPLPGLLFAGAITHGAGVEAVVISGALAAEAIVPGLLAARPVTRHRSADPACEQVA